MLLESLSPFDINHKMTSLWTRVHCIIPHQIPMINYSLRKSLPTNCKSKSICKFERLYNWKIGFNVIQWSPRSMKLLKHMATPLIQHIVSSVKILLRCMKINQIYGLRKPQLGSKLSSIEDPLCACSSL